MENRIGLTAVFFAVLLAIALVSVPVRAPAKVTGQCAQCHTMHNSQGGTPMALDIAGNPQTAPNETLLRYGCVACHTGTNDGTNNIPYVNKTTLPTYGPDGTTGETLAGGNFYWVAAAGLASDPKGHNVASDGLANQDATLGNTPPGSSTGALASQLTCAGITGCHGDRTQDSDFGAMSGTHHADDSIIDGTTVVRSYRFLDGVVGLEDSDWEYQPTASAHNQYKGADRASDSTGDVDATTISSLCARCHNDFHNGSGNVGGTAPSAMPFSSPWVRHPTDFDMGNTGAASEYRGYGGSANAYVVAAPVASVDVTTVLQTVTFNNDTIVTCISCHRAHGTPYDDLLRWDYSSISAGGGGSGGCFECHTTKN